jgi:heterodisulfide reductase subunit C
MDGTAAKQLCDEFISRVHALPHGGRKIDECLQCGTCSASCPTSGAMEYSPREIIASLRAGMLGRVLRSNTIWMCTSCYSCTVRCPAGIPFTDVMYELKRLCVQRGMVSADNAAAVMAHQFVKAVNKYGRNHETELVRNYYLHTNPFNIFGQMPMAIRMFSRGRLAMRAHKIKGLGGLRRMLDAIHEDGTN